MIHVRMGQNPAQDTPITGANDEDVHGGTVGEERHVSDHFLVHEFIALGDLDHAVEHHDAAVGRALEKDDLLEGALDANEFARHEETLAPVWVQRFIDPAIDCHDARDRLGDQTAAFLVEAHLRRFERGFQDRK